MRVHPSSWIAGLLRKGRRVWIRPTCGWIAGLLLVCAVCGVAAPAAQAGFGVEEKNFEATTCAVASCTYAGVEADHEQAYTQAAGHPQYGITSFEFNYNQGLLGREPIGNVKNVRVDIPPGLAADPEALPKCPIGVFEEKEEDSETHKKECPETTRIGEDQLTVFVALANLTITGTVYNLQQPPGLPLDFGIHVAPAAGLAINEHIFLEGHVSWNTDFHEYFEIKNISKATPILKSKLIFKGRAGEGNFLTLPSVCSSTTTSHLEVESWEGEISRTQTHAPAGVEGCGKVPFKPTAEVHPETAQSDEPDGAVAEVKVLQNVGAEEINTADIDDAHVTLPEGLTLDPSAAHGLATCTAAQAGLAEVEHPAIPGERPTGPVTCPAASQIGTVTIETDLPPGSLTGNVHLGSPAGAPITGPPYTIYLDAESALGVSVRLQGQVNANPDTGRLEATFRDNPQLPFSDLAVKLDGGPLAPLANPLSCATGQTEALFTPYTGGAAALSSTPFAAGGCPSPLPFVLSQSTSESSHAAGAHTSYTFNLARADGQRYLQQVRTTLPPGLVGLIPAVPLCGESQAGAGTCPSASEIGTASVTAGSGPQPYGFGGRVYLTGPYGGSPYGLSIVVPALAGPFDFGEVLARAGVGVEPYTGRVVVTGAVPTIVRGVPLRLRTLSVAVTHPNFLLNPTGCGPLATESLLTGFVPEWSPTLPATSSPVATQSLASPFQVGECGKLRFTPKLIAATGARATRANGVSLEVKLTQGAGTQPAGLGQANIREVLATLPKLLPSRLATLQKACPAATFEAGTPPGGCHAESQVGTATATTPVLPPVVCTGCRTHRAHPGPLPNLTGSVYFVSHGGAAFPDLDVVLHGDGVTVVLVGHTFISSAGITTSSFETLPDVPVSSFTLRLPVGPHSALTAAHYGSLCGKRLEMPTTLVAQSGARLTQRTKIAVRGCPRHRRHRHRPLKSHRHGHGEHRRHDTPPRSR